MLLVSPLASAKMRLFVCRVSNPRPNIRSDFPRLARSIGVRTPAALSGVCSAEFRRLRKAEMAGLAEREVGGGWS